VLAYNDKISETKEYLKTSNIGLGNGIYKVTNVKISMELIII